MKKSAYYAVLALCTMLGMSGCGLGKPISDPSVSEREKENGTGNVSTPADAGGRLVSVDHVEKYISIAQYKEIPIDPLTFAITDEQVEEKLRALVGEELEEITDPEDSVRAGDLAEVGYLATKNGNLLEREESYWITVGAGEMQAGFEEGLLGMKTGETKVFPVAFAEDYEDEALAGEIVTYQVTLQSIYRAPAVDDAYIAAHTDVTTLKKYIKAVRKEIKADQENILREQLTDLTWNQVLMNSEVTEYPKEDLENARDAFRKQVMKYNNDSGMELEEFVKSQGMSMEEFDILCNQYAQSKVKQNLIVQGIMDAEGMRLEDEESLKIQEQLMADMGTSSLAQLIDEYGQVMVDEAIGLIRVENFIADHVVIIETAPVEDGPADGAEEKTEPVTEKSE